MSSSSPAASVKSAPSLSSTESTTSTKSASGRSTASIKTEVSAGMRRSAVCYTPAFNEAVKLADDFHDLSRDLEQARATLANVEKLAKANNFRKIDWNALEPVWALDHDGIHKQLGEEIAAKMAAFEVAKEGLAAALALLDEVESRAWWQQCQSKYSSMSCFADYTPPGSKALDNEEEDIIETKGIEIMTIEDDDTKDDTIENGGSAKETFH